jgi:hypothetical protein
VGCAASSPLGGLDPSARDARLAGDAAAVLVYRAGLRDVVAYVDARPDVFAPNRASRPTLRSRETREAVWVTWQRLLDYLLALDMIGRAHQRFPELPPPDRERSFAIGYAAFVASYRVALELLNRLDRNPGLQPLLNERCRSSGYRRAPTPEYGFGSSTCCAAPSSPPWAWSTRTPARLPSRPAQS